MAPNFAGAFVNRGFVYAMKGNYNRAIEDFDQALARIPNSAHALFNRGIVKMRKGDRMGGRADIAQARLLDPDVGN
jgi:Flp pilus assembly protein TadD